MSVPDNSPNILEGTEVDWIVEDPAHGGNMLPFANFGSVKFTNMMAASTVHGPDWSNSRTINMAQKQGLAEANFGGGTVQVKYTGP